MREKTNLFVMVFLVLSCVKLATADDTQDASNTTIIASASSYTPDGNYIAQNSGTNTVIQVSNNSQNATQVSQTDSTTSTTNPIQHNVQKIGRPCSFANGLYHLPLLLIHQRLGGDCRDIAEQDRPDHSWKDGRKEWRE